MIFDWHISVGTVVEVATMVIGGLLFLWSMKARLDQQGTEISDLKSEVSKLADVLTKLALQDQRITNQDKIIDELRHGIGFIVPPPVGQR